MTSLAPRPRMRSAWEVPGRKSGPEVPVMFAAHATAETPSTPATASVRTRPGCFTMTPSVGDEPVECWLPVRAPRGEADTSGARGEADRVSHTRAQDCTAARREPHRDHLAGAGSRRAQRAPAVRGPSLDGQRARRRDARPDRHAARPGRA